MLGSSEIQRLSITCNLVRFAFEPSEPDVTIQNRSPGSGFAFANLPEPDCGPVFGSHSTPHELD
jgi:hypothetical protein